MAKKQHGSEKKNNSVYIIAGKEASLLNVECEKLLEELLEPHQRVTGLFNADAVKTPVSEVFDELRTAPFLSDKRVVVIKDADGFVSQNRPLIEKYFDNPCPTGILIMTVSSWPGQTRLARKLNDVGKLISITQPKPWQLGQRLATYAAEAHGKNLAKDAAELLIELTGDNVAKLYGEIDKLALFAHGEKSITAGHIESLIGHNRMFNSFAVIDACLAGDTTGAVNRLRTMFAEDKSAEYTVVGAFAFHLRRMFNAKVLLQKGLRPAEVASRVRIWSNKDGFFAQLRRVSLKQIGLTLGRLAATDYAIKTGREKAPVAAEKLVLKLACDF
jgi:DNA polymerase-3 subunit delta